MAREPGRFAAALRDEMPNLYLIRHAHADWTEDEMRPLSARGRAEAERVTTRLIETAPAAIYSSPYARARQTVEPLAARLGMPIEEVADLRERCLAAGEVADFEAACEATWRDFDFAHPGGETNRAAQRRGLSVCRWMVERHDGAVVVATHGTLLALVLNAYDDRIGFDFWRRITTPDIYLLRIGAADGSVGCEKIWER